MKDEIKSLASEFIHNLGVEGAEVSVSETPSGARISISASDDHLMVGRENERFEAFSHLLKRVIAKKVGEEIKISIDVNNILSKQEELLKAKAKMISDRAREFKMNIEMEPMSSYDRMIVHTALEGMPNIKTESIGVGKDRKIVVKYIEKDKETF